MICGIPSDKVEELWDVVSPLIESAMSRDAYPTNDILSKLLSSDMQLWMCGTDKGSDLSICITEIAESPIGNICRVRYIAGSQVREWLGELSDTIEPWAKANGCVMIETYGRKGWERYSKEYGYEFLYSCTGKRI